MMVTLNLAVRNLLRNRRRSLATLVAMAIGSTAILLFGGFSASIEYLMQTKQIQTGGHLQIQHKDFFLYGSGNPSAYGIADYPQIIEAIKTDTVLGPMVLVASPSLQFGGIAGNYEAGVSRTIIGNGYVASDINKMRRWNNFGLPDKSQIFALEGAAPDSAIVGVGVARVLQLCDALAISNCPKPQIEPVGAGGDALPADIAQLSAQEASQTTNSNPEGGPRKIEVLVGNARGAPNVTALQVIRAEDQGVKELDEVYMMMHLAQIQRLIYGAAPPKATSIMLQLRQSAHVPMAKKRLQPIIAKFAAAQPLVVLDIYTLNPFYVQTIRMFDTIFGFVFVLIGAIVLFTVSNTMNTAVIERTVEIGTLRAIGLRRAGIRSLFVTEGALLGFSGAILGVLLSLTLSSIVNNAGLTWMPPGNVEPLPLLLLVYGQWAMITGTSLGLMFVAVVSAWWPAYRAAQMNVVDALRHV